MHSNPDGTIDPILNSTQFFQPNQTYPKINYNNLKYPNPT